MPLSGERLFLPPPGASFCVSKESSAAKAKEDLKKAKIESMKSFDDDPSYIDLDYDDFEKAMRDEEMGGITSGKF